MPTIEHHHGAYLITRRNGTQLVQTDFEYPATAESFGWSIRRVQWRLTGKAREGDKGRMTMEHLSRAFCQGSKAQGKRCAHSGTDGTVDCPECKMPAGMFIQCAAEFLDSLC